MGIRRLNQSEIEDAISLVWNTFLKFEAPDYIEEGIHTFKKCITSRDFLTMLDFHGAFEKEELAGIIATRNEGNHIALFFVREEYQRKGIGRKLFEKALKNSTAEKITVNSSPFAVEIYHKLGFFDTGIERQTNGMRYTPMERVV